MTSSKPYLIRAMHEWLVDNELTPYLMVDVTAAECQVPLDYVEDDRIILNVSPRAVRSLVMDNNEVAFDARFSGVVYTIIVPVNAVLAIYASENGRGMVFDSEEENGGQNDAADGAVDIEGMPQPDKSKKPNLRVVK